MTKQVTVAPQRVLSYAVSFLLAVTITATPILAQQPAATTGVSTLVAVVDLTEVFDSHQGFKSKMETIQQQLKTADRNFETQQKDINARSQQLAELDRNSDAYRNLEAELARRIADTKVQARQIKTDFMQREAVQYYAAYQEILAAVDSVARRLNISLVLRNDKTEMDPENPQSVALGMSRSVVLQRNIDITHLVIAELQTSLANQDNPSALQRR